MLFLDPPAWIHSSPEALIKSHDRSLWYVTNPMFESQSAQQILPCVKNLVNEMLSMFYFVQCTCTSVFGFISLECQVCKISIHQFSFFKVM